MEETKANRQIPRTRLREIYKLLTTCNRLQFHLEFVTELARGKNFEDFAWYLDDDITRFHAYKNSDRLDAYNERASLPRPEGVERLAGTNDIAALLHGQRILQVFAATSKELVGELNYVDREIRPCRTTGNATYVDGLPAGAQQHFDLLLVGDKKVPAIGEVKIRNDKNPFYALVQLLMYAGELLGEHQRERLSRSFPGQFAGDFRSLDLYIILHEYNPRSETRQKIVAQTSRLSEKLIHAGSFNQHIRSIHCVDLKLRRKQSKPFLEAVQVFSHKRP